MVVGEYSIIGGCGIKKVNITTDKHTNLVLLSSLNSSEIILISMMTSVFTSVSDRIKHGTESLDLL